MPIYQLVSVQIDTVMTDDNVNTSVVKAGPDACTPAEVEVLRLVYGPDRVHPIAHVGLVERDVREEMRRLERRYGRTDELSSRIRSLFPGAVPRLPETVEGISIPKDDPATKATIASLQAEVRRRGLRQPAGRPTIRRLQALLDGEGDPGEDEKAEEPALVDAK